MSSKSDLILSIEDIKKIRAEIAHKNGNYLPSKHAHLFSEKVHAHLDEHFISLTQSHREELKTNLIKNTLAKGKTNVEKKDVLNSLTEINLPHSIYENENNRFFEKNLNEHIKINNKWIFYIIPFFILWLYYWWQPLDIISFTTDAPEPTLRSISLDSKPSSVVFPYVPIDVFELMEYIQVERQGLVGQPEHTLTVLNIAQLYNIDALLLFAILGQEQNFVPQSHPNSHIMINNPFNVFHSWEVFNTNLEQSTQIAIRTIQNRMLSLPPNEDPIMWINGIYAEDPNWHIGVKLFYDYLTKRCAIDTP